MLLLACLPQWYTERMEELRRRILEERDCVKGKVVPSAFVTFKCARPISSQGQAVQACRCSPRCATMRRCAWLKGRRCA